MQCFILAGGFATRLWPLTEKRAKPLLSLAGKPILSHILEKIPAAIPVAVSTNAAFEQGFTEWKQTMNRPNLSIVIEKTLKEDQKLGTNGAVAQWITEHKVEEDLLLVTGDNYLGFAMEKFITSFTPGHPLLAAYDIGKLEEASKFGTVIVDGSGKKVIAFEEKPKEPKTTLVSTGCYLIPAACLPILVEYAKTHPDHIGGIFEEFLKQKISVDCFTFSEPWFDIGSFSAYLEATKKLVGEHLLSDNATFEESIREGGVVLGAGTIVTQSTLRNTVIFDNCVIEDCILEDCVIDNDCHLKGADLTGKMIRAGTRLMRE